MQFKDVRIIDLRPYTQRGETTLITSDGNTIIFIKEVFENSKCYHALKAYDILNDSIGELYRFEMPNDKFHKTTVFPFGEKITLIKSHKLDELEVDIYNIETGSTQQYIIPVAGEVAHGITMINERYFLFNIDNGNWNFTKYLADINTESSYEVKDKRITDGWIGLNGCGQKKPTIENDANAHVVFFENYMCDYESEELYEKLLNKKLKYEDIYYPTESMHIISIDSFAKSIKSGENLLPLKTLCQHNLDGWVRPIGADEKHVYYRDKDYASQIERIMALNATDMSITEVTQVDHKKASGHLYYDGQHVYESITNGEITKVTDVVGSNEQVTHPKEESLHGTIKEHYVVTGWWSEDEDGENYKEYVKITDRRDESSQTYEAFSTVVGDMLILYNTDF